MDHLAVDLSSRQSQWCLRSSEGILKGEDKTPTRKLKEFFEGQPKGSRVVLETCAEAFTVANWARAAGHDVRVVRATLAKSLGVGDRGVKTDKRDARNLSKTSCCVELESVHIPSTTAQEQKAMLTGRTALVRSRTLLINSVRGYLRTQVLLVTKGDSEGFPKRIRQLLLLREEGIPAHLERRLAAIEAVTKQIREADKELEHQADLDKVCCRLMTVPGVGPVTAMTFRATVDECSRFEDAHKLESYLGLTPGENSSGDRTQRTGLTRAGSPRMRAALVQAAWAAWRSRPNDPMVAWARALAERRGNKLVAITALARKMSGVLYALWRDNTEYRPRPSPKNPDSMPG